MAVQWQLSLPQPARQCQAASLSVGQWQSALSHVRFPRDPAVPMAGPASVKEVELLKQEN
jgi:hypothetical protein